MSEATGFRKEPSQQLIIIDRQIIKTYSHDKLNAKKKNNTILFILVQARYPWIN